MWKVSFNDHNYEQVLPEFLISSVCEGTKKQHGKSNRRGWSEIRTG